MVLALPKHMAPGYSKPGAANKPVCPMTVDWESPFAKNLVMLDVMDGGDKDLTGFQRIDRSSSSNPPTVGVYSGIPGEKVIDGGTQGYAEMPDYTQVYGKTKFSCTWIIRTYSPAFYTEVGGNHGVSASYRTGLQIFNAGTIFFLFGNGANNYVQIDSAVSGLVDGDICIITGVFDGDESIQKGKVYINGEYRGSANTSGSTTLHSDTTRAWRTFNFEASGTTYQFDDAIYMQAGHDRAFTAAEIRVLHADPWGWLTKPAGSIF